MSVFSRIANLARGQVKVLRKRWSEPDPPVPAEVEELLAEGVAPAASDSDPATPAAEPDANGPEVLPDPRDLSQEPPKKNL